MGKREISEVAVRALRLFAVCVCIGILLAGTFLLRGVNNVQPTHKIPDGFVAIETLKEAGFDTVFWESQISIIKDQKCIYQTSANNKDFILKYQGKYYVNSAVLNELK